MNLTDILSVLGGAVLGAAVAYINMRISKANMNASNMAAVMGVNMLRLLLDAAAIALGIMFTGSFFRVLKISSERKRFVQLLGKRKAS